MLKTDVLWPQSRRFKSRTDWEPIGFFSEALCNSTQFDLKLGFFSSSAINILSDSFATFLYNGGQMRLVINDILSEEDQDAIIVAESNKDVPFFDLRNIEEIKNILSERDRHFFECLSWLIRNERIEFQIISPKNGIGIAHSKCGLFSDGLNRVAFEGSCNFSRTALVSNIESITAFCDWDGKSDICKIEDIVLDFEKTFNKKDDTVIYLNAEKIKKTIVDTFSSKEIKELLKDEQQLLEKRLNSNDSMPESISRVLRRAKNKIDGIIIKTKQKDIAKDLNKEEPQFPYSEPREYQKQAYENWKSNKQKGLFAMATGTGKTLTSLNCLLNIYKKYHFYKAIILVPTITLVDQWETECRKFNFTNIYKVCSKNHNWKDEIDNIKLKEDFNISGIEPSYIIIATYASFARDTIFHDLVDFNKKAAKQILLIADEAHNMGANRILDRLEEIKFLRRIGLSATPKRQFDEKGNKEIMRFFGAEDHYTFEFTMQEAIDHNPPYLCRYYYYPHLVRLTPDEMSEYINISLKLAKFFNYDKNTFPQGNDILKSLLLKRKRIIQKAKNKKEIFRDILYKRYKEKGNLKYTLVYVPEGNRPDDNYADMFDTTDSIPIDVETDHLIDDYTQIVKDISDTTTVRKFTSGIKERDKILADFASGKLEVLTSMKCLDEGVDVPRSELAIFCASTGNPRQFIQRRGRILRLHPDKKHAVIHDLVVAPEINSAADNYKMERNLLSGEICRVRDFARLSENADYAYTELENILSYYNISLF